MRPCAEHSCGVNAPRCVIGKVVSLEALPLVSSCVIYPRKLGKLGIVFSVEGQNFRRDIDDQSIIQLHCHGVYVMPSRVTCETSFKQQTTADFVRGSKVRVSDKPCCIPRNNAVNSNIAVHPMKRTRGRIPLHGPVHNQVRAHCRKSPSVVHRLKYASACWWCAAVVRTAAFAV